MERTTKMKQRHRCKAAATAAIAAAAIAALPASGAMTSTLGGIHINTTGSIPTIATPAAYDDFIANWRVTFQAGETVTATAPNSSVSTLAGNAGAATLIPCAAGTWTLDNSNGGSASVTVLAAALSRNSAPLAQIGLDTVGAGPNRTVKAGRNPPVAYSGDDWRGNASAASTLTFTPPMGADTTQNLSGTGATAFQFRQPGAWTVQLEMASGSPLSAIINIEGIPTRLNFR